MLSEAYYLIGVLTTLVVAVWWLSAQFNSIKTLVYSKTEQLERNILGKLEYHERHDDARFNSVDKDLWAIRVRNAARDGIGVPVTADNKK